jgi:hypothetical protein
VGPADLGHRGVDVDHDRHHRHAGSPLRALAAQLGQPPVVGPGPGEEQLGRGVAGGAEAGPERRGGAAGDGVGVGEDDLAGHAVGVELLVPPGRVPAAAQALLVLLLPGLGELLVEEPGLGHLRGAGALLEEPVEALPVLRVEPLPVLGPGQPGVGVGRDHQVAAHRRSSR